MTVRMIAAVIYADGIYPDAAIASAVAPLEDLGVPMAGAVQVPAEHVAGRGDRAVVEFQSFQIMGARHDVVLEAGGQQLAAVAVPHHLLAEDLADALREELGRAVVVENRPGGGGMTVAINFLRAPKDGNHLMLATGSTAALVAMAFLAVIREGFETAVFLVAVFNDATDPLNWVGGLQPQNPGDVVIVNTGWHHIYEDNEDYFARAPGFVSSAGHWFVEKKVKVVGHDTQANDHPLATAIGPQRNGPLLPHLKEEYFEWSGGRDWKDDFPEWEPVHRILFNNGILGIENVGGLSDLPLTDAQVHADAALVRELAAKWPTIKAQKAPLPDADAWKGREDKRKLLER